MNRLFTALASSVVLFGCASTFAASTVDLTVKGFIVPSACTPGFTGGGVIDHGKHSAKDLIPNNPTALGVRVLTMTLLCNGPTRMAFHAIDNRKDSALSSSVFGLGLINGTQKLGWFSLTLRNPVADGTPVQPIASGDGGNTWFSEKFWDPGLYMSVGAMDDATQPVPLTELTAEVEVHTMIARTDGLDLSNEVNIDGLATVEVKYL